MNDDTKIVKFQIKKDNYDTELLKQQITKSIQELEENQMMSYEKYIERRTMWREHMEDKMQAKKEEALKAISLSVRPELVESYATILSFAWMEEIDAAKIIAEKLNLDKEHFLSINDELDLFEKNFVENMDASYEPE